MLRDLYLDQRNVSFFGKCTVLISLFVLILDRFAQGLHLRQVDMLQDGIAKSSATLFMMSKKLRRICVKSLGKHQKKKKQKVGGVNVLVHIDESKFCHKRKVISFKCAIHLTKCVTFSIT